MKIQNSQHHKPFNRLQKGLKAVALCAMCWLPVQTWAQAMPGMPRPTQTPTPTPQGGGSGGFGFSLDLGSVLRAVQAVQALNAEERYSSPDTTSLNAYEPRQIVMSWENAQQSQAAAAVQASGGTLLANVALPNLSLNIVVLSYANDTLAGLALAQLRARPGITADRHAISYPMQQTAAPVPAKQYAHELLKAPPKGSGKLGASMTVGIIDTEVTNADSLALANFKGKRIFADTDKPAPADHGNAVASIVAASGNGFEGLAQGITSRTKAAATAKAPRIDPITVAVRPRSWPITGTTNVCTSQQDERHQLTSIRRRIFDSRTKSHTRVGAAPCTGSSGGRSAT